MAARGSDSGVTEDRDRRGARVWRGGWIVRRWVDSRGSGSVGWFAWRNCAAVEDARLSTGERSIAMCQLLGAVALAHGFLFRSGFLLLCAILE